MFNASAGWLNRYKNRVHLHNVNIAGEVASANEEAESKYRDVLKTRRL